MSIFSRLLEGIGSNRRSAKVAQERLQIILSHERTEGGNIDFLPRMRHELLAVIEKYVKVDKDQVNVQLQRTENCSILELNITFPTPAENLKIAQPNK